MCSRVARPVLCPFHTHVASGCSDAAPFAQAWFKLRVTWQQFLIDKHLRRQVDLYLFRLALAAWKVAFEERLLWLKANRRWNRHLCKEALQRFAYNRRYCRTEQALNKHVGFLLCVNALKALKKERRGRHRVRVLAKKAKRCQCKYSWRAWLDFLQMGRDDRQRKHKADENVCLHAFQALQRERQGRNTAHALGKQVPLATREPTATR